MAQIPTIGPNIRKENAQCQPIHVTKFGSNLMVIRVRRKPRLVCKVKAVPIYSGWANSLIHAENCAESATTAKPYTKAALV
jgi:hypothetical protein